MNVFNKTQNSKIAESILQPKSLKDQSIGLLAHKKPVAMLLKTKFGIHTLFMKYPIDVLILDKTNHVVAMKEHMQPNDYFVWSIKYNTVLELPSGSIAKTNTRLYDVIAFDIA